MTENSIRSILDAIGGMSERLVRVETLVSTSQQAATATQIDHEARLRVLEHSSTSSAGAWEVAKSVGPWMLAAAGAAGFFSQLFH